MKKTLIAVLAMALLLAVMAVADVHHGGGPVVQDVRSTGTIAWTPARDAARTHVLRSGTNLIIETGTTVSGATSPGSRLTAISTTTGATAWTLAIDGSANIAGTFSGGTYVVVTRPSTSTTAAVRRLIAVSNSGTVLWTVSLT